MVDLAGSGRSYRHFWLDLLTQPEHALAEGVLSSHTPCRRCRYDGAHQVAILVSHNNQLRECQQQHRVATALSNRADTLAHGADAREPRSFDRPRPTSPGCPPCHGARPDQPVVRRVVPVRNSHGWKSQGVHARLSHEQLRPVRPNHPWGMWRSSTREVLTSVPAPSGRQALRKWWP